MIIPKRIPDLTKQNNIEFTVFCLAICQIILVYCYYAMFYGLYERIFLIFMLFLYMVIIVYGLGYLLDNSPLLGVTSLLVCYIIIYCMGMATKYNDVVVWCFVVAIILSAYIKNKHSLSENKQPIVFDVFMLIILGFFLYALPFYIYNQNRENLYYSGLQML